MTERNFFNSGEKLAQEELVEKTVSSRLIISFFLAVGLFFIVIFAFADATLVKANATTTGVKKTDTYNKVNDISVSATVLSRLGYKTIDEYEEIKAINVFGNYEKGFRLENKKTGEIIFEQNTMPGEGVFIQFEKTIDYLLHPKE